MSIRVMIADDQALVGAGFRVLLDAALDIAEALVVSPATSRTDISRILNKLEPATERNW